MSQTTPPPGPPVTDRTAAEAGAEMPSVGADDIDDSAYRSGLPGPLGWLDQGIARLESVLLALGVLAMAANTCANVVGRYLFGQSLYWSEELNQALIILITFAGISYAARHGRHIRMSAFFDMLPFRARKLAMVLISAITAALLLGLAWYAYQYVATQAARGRVMPALRIPNWWILVWVPLGFFLTGLQYALTAIRNLIDPAIWLSTGTLEGYDDNREEEV